MRLLAVLLLVAVTSGCANNLLVTGPLTAISAGVSPRKAFKVWTNDDGAVSGQVGIVNVQAEKSAGGKLLHYALMALEGWGYYELGKALEDDDEDSSVSVPEGFEGIWVGGDADGKFDTLMQPIVVQGNARGRFNTGGPEEQ